MKRLLPLALLAGCGDLAGFSGEVPPLATITITSTGDFEAVRAPNAAGENLHVALVWGTQWLPEATCFLPPESPELAAVVAAGCRNPLSFTPERVTADAPLVPNQPVSLDLFSLPSADLMVGDVTARIAYASLVIYDDRDGDGVLRLARARRLPTGGPDMGPPDPEPPPSSSLVYGASFVAMTEPDTRLAFREGAFLESGFYPRHGCGTPPPAFSLLSAGGFSFTEAVAATVAGTLPSEDPATCSETAPEAATVTIPLRAPAEVREVRCEQRREDSSVRYRRPPTESLDLASHPYACASIASLGGGDPIAPPGTIQLVVAGASDEQCRSLTHYTLLGCDESGTLICDQPEWDYRAEPPAWWPCPVQAP
jgi:hypothetical protein